MCTNILQLNIQSINNKLDLLEKLLNENSIDIALIQETWTIPNQKIKIKSFNTIINSRINCRGGGVAIIIRNNLPYQTVQTTSHEKIEHIEVRTTINGEQFHLISFYNPNQENAQRTKQNFNQILEKYKYIDNTIICGDINAASGLWNNTGHEDGLGKIISDLIVNSPYTLLNDGSSTRMNLYNNSESAIDISLVSSNLSHCSSWKILEDNIGSDHKPILINLAALNPKVSKISFQNKANSMKAINDMPTDQLTNVSQFTDEINRIVKQNTKTIEIDPRKVPKKWWNEHIERLWKIKREKQRIYNQKKDLHTAMEMKKAINKLKLEIKKAKKNSWNDFVNQMSNMNTSQIWNTIRTIRNSNKQYNPILTDNDVAKKFLDHNFPKSIESLILPFAKSNRSQEFTMKELKQVIQNSKNTAPGVDKINYELIKSLNEDKLEKFLQLLNSEFRNETYPEIWKLAKIIGIPKQNTNIDRYENLRPISLLSIPAKILDKMILNRMTTIANNCNLVPANSFGFIRGRSINELFVNVLQQIEENKKTKMKSIIIKLDIHKAFDSVNKNQF